MMSNTINKIKNSLEGINSRITEAEKQISDLEDKIVEITTAEQNKENILKAAREKQQSHSVGFLFSLCNVLVMIFLCLSRTYCIFLHINQMQSISLFIY